jgi:hypothetical protein
MALMLWCEKISSSGVASRAGLRKISNYWRHPHASRQPPAASCSVHNEQQNLLSNQLCFNQTAI